VNIGLCLSDLHPQVYGDGSGIRTAAAVHFAGNFRLIDFMLSNLVNSSVYSIAIVLGSQYQSLLGHIGSGREWDLARSSGGVHFFPPYPLTERPFNEMRDEPLQRALTYIESSKTDDVLVADCSTIYNLDFQEVLAHHRSSSSDVTAIYVRKPLLEMDQPHAVVYKLGSKGRISDIVSNPAIPPGEEMNISLGAYILKKNVLLRLLSRERSCDIMKFSCGLLAPSLKSLKVTSWRFDGYSARISSLDTFFHYNMDMLDPAKREGLIYSGGRRIHTSVRNALPTKYGSAADIRNSIVSNGCIIEGTVENCVIYRDVQIRAGAVVRNSVLQRNTVVGSNAELNWIVTDHDVIISDNRNLLGYRTHPTYIGVGKVV